MAVCDHCNKEMSDDTTSSCIKVDIKVGGRILEPVKYDSDQVVDLDDRCHDCNIAVGGYHHPGCDMERCPNCSGQLISCGCIQ